MQIENKSNLEIELWDIPRALQAFWGNNPRVISETELNKLRLSIREFGTVEPPIFNKMTNSLIHGHQRIRAAQLEGLTQIPMIIVELDEDDGNALALALNRIKGKWDYAKLEEAIKVIAESDILELSGFSEDDVINILSDTENEGEYNKYDYHTFINLGASSTRKNPLIQFKSPDVKFSCLREQYEAFVQALYDKYGFEDLIIDNKFFSLIGIAN